MLYIALTHDCNYKCPCCPCNHHRVDSYLPFSVVESRINEIKQNSGESVTLSGGEPTIHPDFIKIMSLLYSKNIPVTVLTNSSKLNDSDFIASIKKAYPDLSHIRFITTLYNVNADKHDAETGVKNSFNNTVEALQLWQNTNVQLTVKHCVTNRNYKELKSFYEFVHNTFNESVHFQLSGIDYVGMPDKWKSDSKLTSKSLRPYLNEMLDYINKLKVQGVDHRVVYLSSLPLCSASLEYKNYFIPNQKMGQIGYLSKKQDVKQRKYDSVKKSELCLQCIVYDDCAGTYESAFDVMGDDFPLPFYN